jgi:hypothetical protein
MLASAVTPPHLGVFGADPACISGGAPWAGLGTVWRKSARGGEPDQPDIELHAVGISTD